MRMSSYPQRVRNNILPLSVAGTLPEAFTEWYFTENTHDHEEATASCELCDHEEIRYHFQIKNKYTHKELWVGSQCILKFELSVFDDGILLNKKQAQKKLNLLTRKMQLESCIKALSNLAAKEQNQILTNALEYYKIHKYLTPKYAAVVFWRLNQNKIDYHPSFFKISLKKDKYKNALRNMETFKVHSFWKALSPAQKKLAITLGHREPRLPDK